MSVINVAFDQRTLGLLELEPYRLALSLAQLSQGLLNRDQQIDGLLIDAFNFQTALDPWPLWEHLGERVVLQSDGLRYEFNLPQPAVVIEELLRYRQQWLNMLRTPAAELRVVFPNAGNFSDEQLVALARRGAYSYLTMLTLMLLYIRHRWQILPEPSDGVLAGLATEVELWMARLPEQAERHPSSQEIISRFTVQIEGLLGREAPHVHQHRGQVQQAGARVRELTDEARLERYFRAVGFRALRNLRSNRYHYVALLFGRNRVVVDTAQKENRFFLFEGPLAEVLAAISAALESDAIKQLLQQSQYCRGVHRHDEAGDAQLHTFLS